MRKALSLSLAAGIAAGHLVMPAEAAAPPSAPRWAHTATGGENSAKYRERGVELVFRCLGGSMELVLYVDTPVLDPDIQGRPTAYMALIIDDSQVYSFQGRLVKDATTTSIGLGTRGANDFAHFIAGATRSFTTSLLIAPPGPGSLNYNILQYPIAGAAEAIKAAYAGCGVPF